MIAATGQARNRAHEGAALSGRIRVRVVDVAAAGPALALRRQVFRGGEREDKDPFDALSRHVLVEDGAGPLPAACARLRHFAGDDDPGAGYTGCFYDLSALRALRLTALEVGRLCTRPGRADPDVLRAIFAAITAEARRVSADCLFGCTSFSGTRPEVHAPALARLAGRMLPSPLADAIRPRPRAGCESVAVSALARKAAGRAGRLPPLLEAYLSLGAQVADSVVIDRDLGTCHVFTLLDVAAVPDRRARALGRLAAALRPGPGHAGGA